MKQKKLLLHLLIWRDWTSRQLKEFDVDDWLRLISDDFNNFREIKFLILLGVDLPYQIYQLLGLGTTNGLELYGVIVSLCAPKRGKSKSNKITRCPGLRNKWCAVERKVRVE